jgi:hypothetical protein
MFLHSSKEALRGEVSLFLLLGSTGSCVCVGLLDSSYRRWGEWREGWGAQDLGSRDFLERFPLRRFARGFWVFIRFVCFPPQSCEGGWGCLCCSRKFCFLWLFSAEVVWYFEMITYWHFLWYLFVWIAQRLNESSARKSCCALRQSVKCLWCNGNVKSKGELTYMHEASRANAHRVGLQALLRRLKLSVHL